MSEVQRYRFKGAAGEYVYANDYDSAKSCAEQYGAKIIEQQSQLAALREELAEVKSQSAEYGRAFNAQCRKTDDLQQRLADAERRNSALSVLLREGLEESKEGDDWIDRVIAVLSWEASDTRELEHDRAYRNGLMQGYNLAVNGSEKEYQDAVLRYSGAALNKPEEAKS